MSCSPVHEYQMLPPYGMEERPVCDESMFLDDTWKSSHYDSPPYSEDSNNSQSDCVPESMPNSYGIVPSAQTDYSAITGSNAIFGSQVDAYRWQKKNPETWDQLDVALWIQCIAESNRLPNLRSEAFADVDGPMLCKMQIEQFQDREPSYGTNLFLAFSQLASTYQQSYQHSFAPNRPAHDYQAPGPAPLTSIDMERYICNISFDKDDTFRSLPSFESLLAKPPNAQDKQTTPKEEPEDYSPPPSPTDSEGSTDSAPKVGRRGRSKGKLWEFVLNLLLDEETNPNIIKWEDRSNGVFRIVRSDQVAKLWGKRKSNPTMTYEKMSRAMRYYYRKNILERIDGRRLVYKFGPTSRGWQL